MIASAPYRIEVDDGFATVVTPQDVPTFQVVLGQPAFENDPNNDPRVERTTERENENV